MKKLLLTVLLLMAGYSLLLAQKNVSGKVTDKKDGAPIAGVSVTVKGTDLVVKQMRRENLPSPELPVAVHWSLPMSVIERWKQKLVPAILSM